MHSLDTRSALLRRLRTLVAGGLAVLPAIALGADGAGAQTIAITGGKIYPVSGPPIENGTILIRDGKIVAVGANVTIPEGAGRVDATGRWVTPGIFNAATTLGVTEVGSIPGTSDVSAAGERGIAASFPVWQGLNAASPLFQVARNDGITTVGVVPRGGLIAGQAAVIDLSDGSAADMMIKAPVAMVADFSSTGQGRGNARGEVQARVRELLEDVRQYVRRKSDFERAQTRDFAARRADLEALIPVVQGRMLLLLDADRASDIEAALTLAREERIRIAITGGAEAWKVAPLLAAARVPVFVGALNNLPQSFNTLGIRQDNAALLRRAGVPVVISAGADAFNARNVKYEAGVAVAYGLSWDDALRAVTLAPAEVYGVADRVGSLAPGRDATLVLWNGDPFELATRPTHVMVRGKDVLKPSRQDELMRRYRTLPPDYRRVP